MSSAMFRVGSGDELDLWGWRGEGGDSGSDTGILDVLTCREACGVVCPLLDATGAAIPVPASPLDTCDWEGSVFG